MIGKKMKKQILAIILAFFSLCSLGCDSNDGALPDPVAPTSFVVPTIKSLKVTSTQVSRSKGGILGFSCQWTSPTKVATAAAYLAFVRTIYNPVTEPVGIIASSSASMTANLKSFPLLATVASSTATCTTNLETFYSRFKEPIYIASKIGTDRLSGGWSVSIPFTSDDVCDGPNGKQQMLFWMKINGVKTNTLAFEMEFVP